MAITEATTDVPQIVILRSCGDRKNDKRHCKHKRGLRVSGLRQHHRGQSEDQQQDVPGALLASSKHRHQPAERDNRTARAPDVPTLFEASTGITPVSRPPSIASVGQIGRLIHTPTQRESVESQRPIHEAFDRVKNPPRWQRWQPAEKRPPETPAICKPSTTRSPTMRSSPRTPGNKSPSLPECPVNNAPSQFGFFRIRRTISSQEDEAFGKNRVIA